MKKLIVLTLALSMLYGVSQATWSDASTKALIPYFQSVDIWYTLLVVVNGSEQNFDTVYIRFCDSHGNFCSDTLSDAFSIRPGEALIVSTKLGIGFALPVSAEKGYIQFRVQDGGGIHVYPVVANMLTNLGFVLPTYWQDYGF